MISIATNPGVIHSSIHRFHNGASVVEEDELAVEAPLEIQLGYMSKGWRVHKSVSITMRTPGHDSELAAGFLLGEGIIAEPGHIERIETPADNVVRVDLQAQVRVDLRSLERHFYATSSCGVCGKASIAALRMGCGPQVVISGPIFFADAIHGLPGKLRETQEVFDRTGGLHAAALFNPSCELLCRREDVGRHNAVDKLIGARLLADEQPPFSDSLMLVSGRASFELMQKTLAAGIPILAAVGAPSSLAVDLAREAGATLLGFVRDGRFNIYTHPERIQS
ncbi:MAG: formate dehydrogenase accessory sulfurtransferase FdhD [Methylacidiphilales bacterium]|nr:formate dehydrogenase accessory sulfurtransferase FdhD [Candidatus Methylacidiphilales bacterium]